MATIKNTSNTLGNLINQINQANQSTPGQFQGSFGSGGYQSSNIGIDDDSIPVNMLESEPVFEMNYKGTKKICFRKAKEALETIVKEIVPFELQQSKLINSKIEQDAEQLGNLYYEHEKTDKVVQVLMETIARGETQARLFEVYAKMSKLLQDLSAQITDTQNQMRKYYIDTYLDLQQTDNVDVKQKSISQNSDDTPKSLMSSANENNIMLGTDQPIKNIANKKLEALKAKFQEAQDAEIEEVD